MTPFCLPPFSASWAGPLAAGLTPDLASSPSASPTPPRQTAGRDRGCDGGERTRRTQSSRRRVQREHDQRQTQDEMPLRQVQLMELVRGYGLDVFREKGTHEQSVIYFFDGAWRAGRLGQA